MNDEMPIVFQGQRLLVNQELDPDRRGLIERGWYVDGEPFQVVGYPFTAPWRLTPGEHRFQGRLPHTELASREVRVWVQ